MYTKVLTLIIDFYFGHLQFKACLRPFDLVSINNHLQFPHAIGGENSKENTGFIYHALN